MPMPGACRLDSPDPVRTKLADAHAIDLHGSRRRRSLGCLVSLARRGPAARPDHRLDMAARGFDDRTPRRRARRHAHPLPVRMAGAAGRAHPGVCRVGRRGLERWRAACGPVRRSLRARAAIDAGTFRCGLIPRCGTLRGPLPGVTLTTDYARVAA